MRVPRTQLLDRRVKVRDASLFVVATEGKTEAQYFAAFDGPRIKVEVLPTDSDGRSSPRAVLDRLRQFRQRYQLGAGDELWLVIDVDRRKPPEMRDVCSEASRGRFSAAVSNPCFELWLYLHLGDVDPLAPDFQRLTDPESGNRSKMMIGILRQTLAEHGGYQKAHLVMDVYRPGIRDAISKAKELDREPGQVWPETAPCTTVIGWWSVSSRRVP